MDDTSVNKVIEAPEEEVLEGKKVVRKHKLDLKNIIILIADYLFIIMAYVVSLMLLCPLAEEYLASSYMVDILIITPFYAMTLIIVFYIAKLYVPDLSLISIVEVRRLIVINFFGIIIYAIAMKLIASVSYPYIFFLVGGLLQFIFTSGIRFVHRLLFGKGHTK